MPDHFDALILGAGMAGSGIARLLHDAGLGVAVLEKASHCAAGASGNARALAQPYLIARPADPYTTLLEASWEAFERRLLRWKGGSEPIFRSEGAVVLPSTGRLQRLFATGFQKASLCLPESAASLTDRCGVAIQEPGWWLPGAVTVDPRALVAAELEGIPVFYERTVLALEAAGRGVRVTTEQECFSAERVVLAASFAIARLPGLEPLPVEAVHGEVLLVECGNPPRLPVVGSGYALPLSDSHCLIGARYSHHSPLDRESLELVETAKRLCGLEVSGVLARRQAYRCSTFDKAPYVGPLLDIPALLAQKAAPGFRRHGRAEARLIPGVYAAVGFGSHGLLLSSLAAEILREAIVNRRTHPLAALTSLERVARPLLHPRGGGR